MSAPALDPVLQGVARASLALLFAVTAAHKLRDARGFGARVAAYDLLPAWAAAPFARGLAALELALCLALALGATSRAAACAAALLLLAYAGAIAVNLLRGRRTLECGCGLAPRPLGRDLLVRNALLAAVALAAALPASARALGWLDAWTIACATATGAALFAAQDVAAAQRARFAS